MNSSSSNSSNLTFTVFVDDNFHYQDIDERWIFGKFDNYADALAACKKIVDDSLLEALGQKGPMNADQLYDYYTSFGDDPFVSPEPVPESRFSGWNYAKERCQVLGASSCQET